MMRPAVFLDRDGTLMEEVHYCADPKLVRIFPGAGEALGKLADAGFACVIISNQSGIGRGLLSEAQYHAVQAELLRQLGEGRIAASYFCPDAPPAPSPRRKPNPGMVLEAVHALRLDLARSWFIGDKMADIECGARAGTRAILVETGYGKETAARLAAADSAPHRPNFIAKDIVAAAALVLKNQG